MGKLPADEQFLQAFAHALAPFIVAEMRRIEKHQVNPDTISIGALTLDMQGHEARIDGKHLVLAPQEFRLLAALAQNEGMVLSRERLLHLAWKTPASVSNPRAVDVHACRLRKKIRGLQPLSGRVDIVRVQKNGYKLEKSPRSPRDAA